MKPHKALAKHFSRTLSVVKKNNTLFAIIFMMVIFASIFAFTKGLAPNASELSYLEYSILGKKAGSVMPASCDSATPFTSPTAAGGTAGSHFAGDCVTACPGGVGTYDPYFDPTATACPPAAQGPAVSLYFGNTVPTAVTVNLTSDSYGLLYGTYPTLSWRSVGATTCTASGDWSGDKLTGTNRSEYVTGYTNNTNAVVAKNYTLTCTNGSIGAAKTVTVNYDYEHQPSVIDFTADTYSVPYAGNPPVLSWHVSYANSCTGSGSWSGAKSAAASAYEYLPYYQNLTESDVVRTYRLTCNTPHYSDYKEVTVTYQAYVAPDCNLTPYAPGCGGGGCFVAGTQVTMGNGEKKNIENVTFDDSLMTSAKSEPVMKRYVIPYKGLLYAFNGSGNYFVTPTHPFMTKEGWKSLDPAGTRRESPGIVVSKLKIGDELVMKGGKTKVLTQLDSKYASTTVYNFGVNGTHDFYADDYLVHNVDMSYIIEKAYADAK